MKKISKKHGLMIAIVVIGVIAATTKYVEIVNNSVLKEGRYIERPDKGTGDYHSKLKAETVMGERNLDILVEEREYTEDELDALANEMVAALEQSLVGQGIDFENGKSKFNLVNQIKGYPFLVRWNFESEYLDKEGNVLCDVGCSEKHTIELSGELTYRKYTCPFSILVKLSHKKVSDYEKYMFDLDKAIEKQKELSTTESVIELPQAIDGENIVWKETKDYSFLLIFIGSVAVALLVGFAYEHDEKKKRDRFQKNLMQCYPDFVEKLKLYLISGLTVKRSLEKIYEGMINLNQSKYGGLVKALSTAINNYRNGVREETILEGFGNACQNEYRKLSFLLIVNLKQGNDRLLALLDEEVTKAYVQRKDNAKRLSDEAGIKLLFPMMLMLIVVMILIMVPAYLEFN